MNNASERICIIAPVVKSMHLSSVLFNVSVYVIHYYGLAQKITGTSQIDSITLVGNVNAKAEGYGIC